MRNISVTFEDIQWIDDGADSYDLCTGGFIVLGNMITQSSDMTRRDLLSLHKNALQNLDDMIECEHCMANLSQDYNGDWVDEFGSHFGFNFYDGANSHRHKPEKLWPEILVDIIERYGAIFNDGIAFYSEHSVVDYKLGIERQYGVHLEWNVSPEDDQLINSEFQKRFSYLHFNR